MANQYYDSGLTGTEIEAALQKIHAVAVPGNNGKILEISATGGIVPAPKQDYDDSDIRNRMENLELAVSSLQEFVDGLTDGDGVSY